MGLCSSDWLGHGHGEEREYEVVVDGAVVLACGLGGLAAPLSAAASPAVARVRAAA